jgi:hypothetical protein
VPSRRFEEWSAGRLIKGDYPAAEQAPDPDLGKSLHQGYRNISGAGGEASALWFLRLGAWDLEIGI